MNKVLLEGVVITSLKEIFDPRGSVLHMIRIDDPEYNGFGECYFSEINPRAVKAWKFHKNKRKILRFPLVGSI